MTEPLTQSYDAFTHAAALGQAYLKTIPARNVAATAAARAALAGFDGALPAAPSDPIATLDLLARLGGPATTATTGGRFFGLVVGGTLPAALGARLLASSWDQIVLSEATSPIGLKLEQVAARWLLELLGLPQEASVGFVTGATMANFTCLAAARQALLAKQGWDVTRQGLWGAPKLRLVAGRQAHVTVLKALSLLGLGTEAIEWVECDDQGRMQLATLPTLDAASLVITQAGNVHSGASDPIGAIAAKANGAWVHVDGAFGLWAAASPQTKAQLDGYEAADSWVTDGHKWLNTPYDCGLAICRHPVALHAAMATEAPYLKLGASAAPKDMVPEFSRAARGAEVWAALHSLGRSGISALIERGCARARQLAEGLEALGFEILNDVVLNQVVATLPGFEERSADLAAHVRESGAAWFGPTHWRGRAAIRLSVSSWVTSAEDIEITLRAIAAAQKALCR